jgi:ubiquinone/menaquinone biosynthesis C-methylase UbiE
MTVSDWRRKLASQESESRAYRRKIYDMIELSSKKNILDVGCGTGAVTRDIAIQTNGKVTGLDIDPEKLDIARELLSDLDNVTLVEGDVQELPFEEGEFDLVIFHIVLLYVPDKQRAVNECKRVCEKGGLVVASLEPDYEGRMIYPDDPFMEVQLENARRLGADTKCGRKLKYLFTRAGLETVVSLDQDTEYLHIKDPKRKLKMFEDNWWLHEKMFRNEGWSEEDIEKYHERMASLIRDGLLFDYPTAFYAIGKRPR